MILEIACYNILFAKKVMLLQHIKVLHTDDSSPTIDDSHMGLCNCDLWDCSQMIECEGGGYSSIFLTELFRDTMKC